jgi:hypothetical protein
MRLKTVTTTVGRAVPEEPVGLRCKGAEAVSLKERRERQARFSDMSPRGAGGRARAWRLSALVGRESRCHCELGKVCCHERSLREASERLFYEGVLDVHRGNAEPAIGSHSRCVRMAQMWGRNTRLR